MAQLRDIDIARESHSCQDLGFDDLLRRNCIVLCQFRAKVSWTFATSAGDRDAFRQLVSARPTNPRSMPGATELSACELLLLPHNDKGRRERVTARKQCRTRPRRRTRETLAICGRAAEVKSPLKASLGSRASGTASLRRCSARWRRSTNRNSADNSNSSLFLTVQSALTNAVYRGVEKVAFDLQKRMETSKRRLNKHIQLLEQVSAVHPSLRGIDHPQTVCFAVRRAFSSPRARLWRTSRRTTPTLRAHSRPASSQKTWCRQH